MKEIERFTPELSKHARTYKAAKTIYNVIKHGKKGVAKINPALAVVEAGISLIELGISIANYKKAKEVNKQLKMKLEVVKKEYELLEEKLDIEFQKFEIEIEQESEKFIKILHQEREKILKYSLIIDELKETLEIIKTELIVNGYHKELEEQYLSYNEIFLNLLIGD